MVAAAVVDFCHNDVAKSEIVDRLKRLTRIREALDPDRWDVLAGGDIAKQSGQSRPEKQIDRQRGESRFAAGQRTDIEVEAVDLERAFVALDLGAAIQTINRQEVIRAPPPPPPEASPAATGLGSWLSALSIPISQPNVDGVPNFVPIKGVVVRVIWL